MQQNTQYLNQLFGGDGVSGSLNKSSRPAVRIATRLERAYSCSGHNRPRGEKLAERLPRGGTADVARCEAAITPLSYLQRNAETCVLLLGAVFLQRTKVWCSSIGSPPGAARRAGVRKAPSEAARGAPSAEGSVCPATAICVSRLPHALTNGIMFAAADEPRRPVFLAMDCSNPTFSRLGDRDNA